MQDDLQNNQYQKVLDLLKDIPENAQLQTVRLFSLGDNRSLTWVEAGGVGGLTPPSLS